MQSDNIQNNKIQSIKSHFSYNGKIISLLNFLVLYKSEWVEHINKLV